MAEATSDPSRLKIWPSRRRLLVWCLVTVLIWGVCAGLVLFSAQNDARAGEQALRSVADLSDPTEVDLDVVADALNDGAGDLRNARSKLSSPVLVPLRPLPIVGRQLASARALVAVSDDIVGELAPLVNEAQAVRNDPGEVDRIAFLDEVARRFGALQSIIDNADLGPSEDLIGPLADGRAELETRLVDLRQQSEDYALIAAGMSAFLGDSRYLLIGANNAEMRLSMGMHLSVGLFTTADGDFDLPGLTPASEMAPIAGGAIVDSDVDRMWGFVTVAEDFRAIAYSGRFDEAVAPQALNLWEARTGARLDGVLMVDPFVLDALVDVTGPVEINGQTYGAGEILQYMLAGQYSQFDGDAVDARQDVLSITAAAVVDEIGKANWDPIELLRELAPVAEGRHIMAFSRDPVEQAAWQAMGVDGALQGDETGVFLLNNGASKLDPFVKLEVVAATTQSDGEEVVVDYEISVTNNASANLPSYALGPWLYVPLPEAGTYLGRIAVYTPGAVSEAGFVGDVTIDAAGPDGDVFLVSSEPMQVLPGETRTVQFEYRLSGMSDIQLLPSGRFPAAEWTWNGEGFNDALPRTLSLDS